MPDYWNTACKALDSADPILGSFISRFGDERLVPRDDPFFTLARSIAGQQISVKAAATIWGRFEALCHGKINPETVLALKPEEVRSAGLSQRKVEYIQTLAGADNIWNINWNGMDDETVVKHLCELKGVGVWTAEMFLIFYLQRPDILPLGDIGLLRAININYNNDTPMNSGDIRTVTNIWRPWRSVATWYMWRSLDPLPVDY